MKSYRFLRYLTAIITAVSLSAVAFFLVDGNGVAINQSDDALFVHEEYDGLIYVGTY